MIILQINLKYVNQLRITIHRFLIDWDAIKKAVPEKNS